MKDLRFLSIYKYIINIDYLTSVRDLVMQYTSYVVRWGILNYLQAKTKHRTG
jgi:hypothetical protein